MIKSLLLGGRMAKVLYIGSSLVWRAYDAVQAFSTGKAGLVYDPSDLSTLFQDTQGMVPVTSSGDPVGLIRDKSGNGNHAIQPVSAARPTYRTDGILHWLEFDGVDDFLYCPNFSARRHNTIALGIKRYNSFYGWFIEQSANSNSVSGFYVMGATGATFRKSAGASNDKYDVLPSNWSGASGAKSVVSYCYSSVFEVYRNQVLQSPKGVAAVIGDDVVTDTLYINSRAGKSIFSKNDIYGLVIVDGLADRVDIENYLAIKSGVTL